MTVANHIQPGQGPRVMVKIVTVDTVNRKIEGALRDGGLIYIAVFDMREVFVWPQQGEYWQVRKENGIWMLDKRLDTTDEKHHIKDLKPGEAKIYADTIKTLSGNDIATTSAKDYEWTNLNLINGWQDVSLYPDLINNVTSLSGISSDYLQTLPSAAYQYNSLTKILSFRGIIYNFNSVNKFANITDYKTDVGMFGFLGLIYMHKNGDFEYQPNAPLSGENYIILDGIYIYLY